MPHPLPAVRRVAIIGGNRIPFARSNTAYATASNQDMLTFTLQGLIDRYGLHGERLGEVAAGAVIKHSRDFNLTRESVLSTTLAKETPAYDVQQACGTGLETTILVANKIALGQIDVGIAGGVDTTSDAPIGVNENMRKILLEANRGRSTGERVGALAKLRPGMLFKPLLPRNGEPRTGLSMGEHCELMAKRWNISREAQDVLAYESHRKLADAYERGFLNDLMTPYRGLARDNNLREDLTLEKLASLKPAFDRDAGTLTAGNSTPLTDGASAVLLASEEWAARRGLPVLAYLSWSETAAVDFFDKKEGLLMAPVYAVPRMLARAGLSLQDFDFYEIHEAFAAQVLCTLAAWQDDEYCRTQLGLAEPPGAIDRSRLNVNGGSLATGHPFAATGGRIVAGLAKMLAQLDKPAGSARGLISICAAGGQGVVAILER
ncbi:acetyl-CoA C-acetyltransferase [bacterium M00.F.Ca.ET.228.01.1.1]|uniref:acetyl-CoA C-acetyltransferase n=1 Tax=Paraburkholderia phenoliruptrix TaxID=252970 RepID=UPI001092BBDE|nr:acetyl-CoA C-acetyltransferase [Paraburkholderia phenoliruptrix]TGP42528.1 acetyl-CoA C-acetyltransferase [bacterium M00.F.Ca.ET.228.01.1.1]TGS00179.1 acetyl-CoA C-acetyltransferase [bacterium M00.F.Ca.ET.191.01.1.1]TGU04500.1 acetyl-CoA C-acetyltransferase [bacterium M00.F.Ca.ET.155.01.1.1]MBW0450172.1 acetyl-CoA C-acetyltransferase [Paraburkholderia phenoliruptrix]MBW9098572.1 acetyl-CoA C-acetyltransferase [Paraburkholderia phenoliruptrix]